ncbi:MAG: hypothetical protein QXO67_01020 [Candidatus Bathyarchaeia archaeon]
MQMGSDGFGSILGVQPGGRVVRMQAGRIVSPCRVTKYPVARGYKGGWGS